MKIRRVRTGLFHADGRADKNDKAASLSSQFCESAPEFPAFSIHVLHKSTFTIYPTAQQYIISGTDRVVK